MTEAEFELLIVGGGISGCEAAWAASRAGVRTLLVTTSLDTVYNLAEDRAVLRPPVGSLMAECVAELASGSAEEAGPRGERDGPSIGSWALHRRAKELLERQPALHVLQSSVSGLKVEGGRVVGVSTWEGVDRHAGSVALCVGSFMHARLRIGSSIEAAGRLSEMAYDDLYDDLVERGFEFRELVLAAPPSAGSLPYEVACRTFAPEESDGGGMRLPRLAGLYAAGLCVAGYLSYEEAARQGMVLAQRVGRVPRTC